MWLSSSTTKMMASPGSPACFNVVWRTCRRDGLRCWQEALDRLCQLVQFDRLVELDTVLKRDIAQSAGRDIAGQNDDRDRTMKLLPQLCNKLKSVQAVGKIVVGEDEIRTDRPSCHQIQCCDAVTRRGRSDGPRP